MGIENALCYESVVRINTTSPLEMQPRGDRDPHHRGRISFEEVLTEQSFLLLNSKTNTICKKCAQNVKLYGTVSEGARSHQPLFIVFIFILPNPKAVYGPAVLL